MCLGDFAEGFQEVTLEDVPLLRRLICDSRERSCEFSVANLYLWGRAFRMRWQLAGGRLWIHIHGEAENVDAMMWVTGAEMPEPSAEELSAVSLTMRRLGFSGNFQHVREDFVNRADGLERRFSVRRQGDDVAEYIYRTESLATLAGDKFAKKRNLIRQFQKAHPDAECRVLTQADIPLAQGLAERWLRAHPGRDSRELLAEASAWRRLSEAPMERFGMVGHGIFLEEGLVAFSLCSPIAGDMWTEHFEKALREYTGAAQALNQFMANSLTGRCKWLNREQDMGRPGLRQAKQSYHPEYLLRNYELHPLT